MADPLLDALGVQDPQAAAAPAPAASGAPLPAVPYTSPTDAAVRTVLAEGSSDPTERQWIAAVIANRAKAGKEPLDKVVQEPGQFESWSNPQARAKMAAIDPNSDDYKAVASQIAPILAGQQDPSGGATSFYAPKAQAALGRQPPGFENGSGVDVGQSRFFGGQSQAVDPLLSALGVDPGKASAAADADDSPEFDADHPKIIGSADIKDPADLKVYRTLKQGGLFDPQAPAGSEQRPFFNTDPKQVPAGGYYVQNGKVQRAPGGPKESSFGAGLGQGVADVGATLSHALPGDDDSEIKNSLLGAQQIYGAKYGGDAASGAGRFIGQLGASAPVLGAGEAIAAPALEAAGPVGTFLAGKAGQGMTGVGRFLTRGASLAAQGAQTGAGAAALTSSANEGSVGQQAAEGALGGALLGPAAPAIEGAGAAVAKGVKSLVEPLTETGPGKIANRIVGAFSRPAIGDVNPGEIVPGSVPTLATATADPGLAQLERTVRLGPHADQFAARDAQNAQARSDLFDKLKGDEDSIQTLKDARDAATSGARDAALNGQTQPADIKPVLDTIDGILAGPEGKRSEVVKALTAVRQNLFDAQGNPETDAKMLYGVRKDLGDLLSPKASADKSGAQLAASQLKQVQGSLDGAIQDVAPGFKEYLKSYSDLSKPIDEQQLLQSLNISDMRGNITLAKAQSALDKIATMRAKPGANPAKSVSDDTLTQLTALRDDLKRQDNINLARPIGPDTAGHFTTGGRLAQTGVPVAGLAAIAHHPVVAAAVGGAKLLYGMKDKQIMAEVANRLLNPASTAPVSPAVAKAKQGLIQRMSGAAIPAAGGILANRLIPAQ